MTVKLRKLFMCYVSEGIWVWWGIKGTAQKSLFSCQKRVLERTENNIVV